MTIATNFQLVVSWLFLCKENLDMNYLNKEYEILYFSNFCVNNSFRNHIPINLSPMSHLFIAFISSITISFTTHCKFF